MPLKHLGLKWKNIAEQRQSQRKQSFKLRLRERNEATGIVGAKCAKYADENERWGRSGTAVTHSQTGNSKERVKCHPFQKTLLFEGKSCKDHLIIV